MTSINANPYEIDGLNPAFLGRHGIELLAARDGYLTVGMRDCDDLEVIGALRFATGLEIRPMPLRDTGVIEVSMDGVGHRLSDRKASLLDQALSRLGQRLGPEILFAPLVTLLEAGYQPAEAANLLLSTVPSTPELRSFAQRLANGNSLAAMIGDANWFPWLASAMRVWIEQDGDPVELVVRVIRPGPAALMRGAAVQLTTECLILALPMIFVVRHLPAEAAILTGVVACLLVAALRLIVARRERNDFVRAEVLTLVSALAALPIPPAVAVSAGIDRLRDLTGSPYVGDGGRKSLLEALELDGMPAALLVSGALGKSASFTSRYCLARARRQVDQISWLVRLATGAAVGVALILMIS